MVSRKSFDVSELKGDPEVSNSDNMVREAKLLNLSINRRREPEVGIFDSIEPKTSKCYEQMMRLDRRVSLQFDRCGCDQRVEALQACRRILSSLSNALVIMFSISILNQRPWLSTMQFARVSTRKGIESASRIVLMNVTSIRMSSHESDTVS